MCARMLCIGIVPCTGARDQYMAVAGAMVTSLLCGSRGFVRYRCSRVLRLFLPSLADGDEGRRLMDWAGSAAGALETCRSDDDLRDAVMRGVPGTVGVGVWDDEESDWAGTAGMAC